MTTSSQEQERLNALDQYDVLDTPPEEAFDRITRLICRVLDVPISVISLIDGHRQWFKSRQGTCVSETSKRPALCRVVVEQASPLIIEDTFSDQRFPESAAAVEKLSLRAYAGFPLRTPQGQILGTLCAMDTKPRVLDSDQIKTLEDMSAIVMTELELRRLARTDSLTGALSRRAFRDEASRALALAIRHKHAFSCLVLDIDHFKAINDRYGHASGDRVLADVVATCRAKLRKSDIVGRLGGEEFGVALPHTTGAVARNVAEKLRSAIARLVVETEAGEITLSASFGIATGDASTPNIETLLEHADTALYQAKQDGRNRCVAWQGTAASMPSAVRRRVLKAGRIAFDGGHASIDCTVRSISESGAALSVSSSAGIPDRFKLLIEADKFSRLSQVIAKSDRHIEVAF